MVGLGYIYTYLGSQLVLLCQGQTLSSPGEIGSDSSCVLTYLSADTRKFTETGSNERFLYALSEMQGWRLSGPLSQSFLFAALTISTIPDKFDL
jgi:hypothetical protein